MQVFVRVAELGSFTRAASELGLSRARTSEAVSDLEQALGARLLHRTTRSVSLSDDGRAYHDRVRQLLAELDDAEALLSGSRGKLRGRLRLALPMALARAFVVPVLPAFLARHPELALEVRLENRPLHLFEDGVDCAVSYGLPADTGLVAQSIAATQLLTCAAPAYLARRGAPREPAQLEQHDCIPFLALDTGRPAPWSFQVGGAASAWQPRGQLGFNSMEACVEAAAAGLGVTQVISKLAAGALKKKRLRAVLGPFVAPGPSIYVVYPPQRQASSRLRALLEFLRTAFAARAG